MKWIKKIKQLFARDKNEVIKVAEKRAMTRISLRSPLMTYYCL
jgi:hypothetical protein